MANERYYKEIRRMAKVANQRMVRMERSDYKSPSYEAAQAFLETMGMRHNDFRGRRFPEHGKFEYQNSQKYYWELKKFLESKTSTIKGYKSYRDDVWESSRDKYNLDDLGISRDEWFQIWQNMSNKKKDRLYDSEVVIQIVTTLSRINKSGSKDIKSEYIDENQLDIKEILGDIRKATAGKAREDLTLKEAYNAVGINYSDISTTRKKLGKL